MFGVECFDTHDNPIDHYTQWDIDQKLKIVVYDADSGLLKNAPYIHFANVKSTEALVVRSTVEGTDTIVVDVPNSLLQESWPLLVYVYLNDNLDAHSQKTIIKIEIPVHKRVRPSDYEYVENIERITAETIKQEVTDTVYDEFVGNITSGTLSLPYMYITDATNGHKQRIGANNDKASLDVNTSGSMQSYSILDTRDKESLSQEIDSDVSAHNSSTSAHSDIRELISDVDSRVDTLNSTVSALDTSKVNKSDIVNNLTTNDATKPLSAAMGMELKSSIDSGGSANELIATHNINGEAHEDIRNLVTAAHERADEAYTAAMAGGGSAAEGIEAHNESQTAHMDIREMIEDMASAATTRTVLWSGAWTAGGIQVDGIQNYTTFVIYSNSNTAMIGFMNEDKSSINCYGILCPERNVMKLESGTFAVSGNQLVRTMPRAWTLTGTAISSADGTLTITRIEGLL